MVAALAQQGCMSDVYIYFSINLCFGPSYRLKKFGHGVFPHPNNNSIGTGLGVHVHGPAGHATHL